MNGEANLVPWKQVAESHQIKDTIFEKWMKYGYIFAVRNADGEKVINEQERERIERVIRIARIGNIDPKEVFLWIDEAIVTAIRIGGEWVGISKKMVDNPPNMVFTPTVLEVNDSEETVFTAKEVAEKLNLSLVYVKRWISYKFIDASRKEDGTLILKESEVRRNMNLGELADFLKVGRVKIHGWISDGTITGIKAGDIILEISRKRVDNPYNYGLKPIIRFPKS